METPRELIEKAFGRLAKKDGYVERADQRQLALLISDCIEGERRGIFEAPTGLGKSLAALIPAIAHGLLFKKRTFIATYTNVLAEQYWRQDLPLALSLFDEAPKCRFLIGRQRYACRLAVKENLPYLMDSFVKKADLGIETEFRKIVNKRPRELAGEWRQITSPPVCPAKMCPEFDSCFYYRARRQAEGAQVLITNHSVVLQDALMRKASEGSSSLLGDYDFLVVDEGHDFCNAALSALEFELSEAKIKVLTGISGKLEQTVLPLAAEAGAAREWLEVSERFRNAMAACGSDLRIYALGAGRGDLLAASPSEVWDHPQIRSRAQESPEAAQALARDAANHVNAYLEAVKKSLKDWKGEEGQELAGEARDSIRGYEMYLKDFVWGCEGLFAPSGVSVSYSAAAEPLGQTGPRLRYDVVGVDEILREIVWEARPFACMSATLSLDGDFDFFKRTTGAEADFEEALPSPFDFHEQAALFIPKVGEIPDPALARKNGMEDAYFNAMAGVLRRLIIAGTGRTLALFHSRREMEAVAERMDMPEEYPIYLQRRSFTAGIGEKFKENVRSSLFGLRSFWTGFDAPGETLSCVALVRVPFEVPVDPPQLVRQAWLQSRGLDPFASYSLPQAKMLMRQGAGRLIRRDSDVGVIAVLDPRIRLKGYGEEILRNLPPDMRVFDDPEEAFGALGIDSADLRQAVE
jgi:ATP-dependent DNA helicase DinG